MYFTYYYFRNNSLLEAITSEGLDNNISTPHYLYGRFLENNVD